MATAAAAAIAAAIARFGGGVRILTLNGEDERSINLARQAVECRLRLVIGDHVLVRHNLRVDFANLRVERTQFLHVAHTVVATLTLIDGDSLEIEFADQILQLLVVICILLCLL